MHLRNLRFIFENSFYFQSPRHVTVGRFTKDINLVLASVPPVYDPSSDPLIQPLSPQSHPTLAVHGAVGMGMPETDLPQPVPLPEDDDSTMIGQTPATSSVSLFEDPS